ncbi:MAG: putative anion transporting ATPase [Ilumatobacteraceae bacterium]|nr:putative anion transporting ATPase [Ilumatobacteraceae bacterium]
MSDGTPTHLGAIVDSATLLVTCGPGGVGKTTSAAALGIAAANRGRRVVVVTVDPARRLADALGIDVDAKMFEPHEVAGIGADGGALWALMLDAETTFDRMIIERTGDEAKAEKILANPVYRSIAGSLAGAQDYMAIERLHQLQGSGDYDLVIIDTPPSRDAIDLLEAPERLMRFLGHPIYRALTMPSRSFAKVANAGTNAFLWVVRRLAGPRLVEDTIEFFRSLSGMEQGLRTRAGEVAELLRADSTSFVLVSSPRSEAIDESTHLANAIIDGGFDLDAVVINLVHPLPPPLDGLDDLADGPLAEHVAYHRELFALASSERGEMGALTDVVSGVETTHIPLLEVDVHDLDGLSRLAALLVGE